MCYFSEDTDNLASASELYQRRYRLDSVGELGTAAVKIATDLKTGKKVALKFISNRDDFRNEVQMLRDLRSEFVVDLVDYYEVRKVHKPFSTHLFAL